MNLGDVTARVAGGEVLGLAEARESMDAILSGVPSDSDIAGLLLALAERRETDCELEGMLDSMMDHCTKVRLDDDSAIDVCGTGGDGAHTFNVSTSAAFIAASAGARVAKHGNRSSSGATGSADIFERLGVDLDLDPARVVAMLDSHKIAFMFAPVFHPAMRNAAAARRLIAKTRTALNLLGPLANPAQVTRHLVGVSSAAHLERIPQILARRGSRTVIAVRSDDGTDELSTASRGTAVIMRDGVTSRERIVPADLGLAVSSLADLQVDGIEPAFGSFVGAVDGTAPAPVVETAALNAGVALVAAGIADDTSAGLKTALESVNSGASAKLLDKFTAEYGDPKRLEEARRS